MAEQLAFDLPANVRLGAEDFFVTEANAAAFGMVTAPESWPDGKLMLVGPPGSGKTHLARLFAAQSGAETLDAAQIDPASPLPDTALVLEDAHALPHAAQEWVFHSHNHLRTIGQPLLITATTPPSRWDLTLPDLESRMAAATLVRIADPDDPLLLAVLLKHFQDRQLMPQPEALTYLQTRLPRSFAAVRDVVSALDRKALEQGKKLTRPFVAGVLDSLSSDR